MEQKQHKPRRKRISLAEANPSWLVEWHPTKNIITPNDLSSSSARKVWWKCANGHEWEASPNNRDKGNGCPYCSNQKILTGYNDLATLRPDLLAEWDYQNNTLDPTKISAGTQKKVQWICKSCGKTWTASIASRAKANTGCTHCRGKTISTALKERNLRVIGPLSQTNPELAAQWHPTANGSLTPNDVIAGSSQKVWWLGTCQHEWQAIINSRVKGNGCPICHNHQLLVGFNDLESQCPELLDEWDYENNDMLPSEVIVGTEQKTAWICRSCGHKWKTITYQRTKLHRGCPKCGYHTAQNTRRYHLVTEIGSLSDTHPHLAEEWHPTKNTMHANEVTYGSDLKVWWLGKCGHEWQAVVNTRAIGGGCPICAGKQVLNGFNDLLSQAPEIAEEWSVKNTLLPDEVLATSTKKFWWTCHTCGHEYYKSPEQRVRYHHHCPRCNTMTSIAENFICYYLQQIGESYTQSHRPDWMQGKEIDVFLAQYNLGIEYDGKRYHQNLERDIIKECLCQENGITLLHIRELGCPELPPGSVVFMHNNPEDYTELEHALIALFEWLHAKYAISMPNINTTRDMQAVLALRAKHQKERSIAALRPDLLEEWDYDKNVVRPELVSVGSDVRVYWKCKTCGHQWNTVASSRAKANGTGCPVCAGRVVTPGYNDLATTHPHIAQQWNHDKNHQTPQEVVAGSHKKVWWRCEHGHEWKAVIHSRVSGVGCPYCSGISVIEGHNDLASQNPQIAADWHYAKNKTTPNRVKYDSTKSYWWKCATCGYEFYTSIKERNDGVGCSKCAGKRRGGRFRFDLHCIPAGALITFLPNPEMHITVANDMMSITYNGQTYSLRQFAAEFCKKPHTQSTYYFAYQDKRLSEIVHEYNQAAPL